MKIDTDPARYFVKSARNAVPVVLVSPEQLKAKKGGLTKAARDWAKSTGFEARAGQHCLVPDSKSGIEQVLVGTGNLNEDRNPLDYGSLARNLPAGSYKLDDGGSELAELGWAMGGYSFDRYRDGPKQVPRLVTKGGPEVQRLTQAVFLARDLINTPANDMGPQQLEKAFRKLAIFHKAKVSVIKGDQLLKKNFPMVHAVGRASKDAPRVLDMVWGKASHPKVTLVGKGVTFDTGGLNIKPDSSMALMKKDMGGAANVLGLAHLIMDAKLPVRLRVIVGAVENSISGNAFRPGDVLPSRKGITVEIGNTDAEGRLVLGDCLALGDEDKPEIMIDMATLTGAARVALGPDLPPFYTDDDDFASHLSGAGADTRDPVWRMPLWEPYNAMMKSKVADVNHINTSGGGFAGSITAALFLKRFVSMSKTWVHFDIFGWVPVQKPWARGDGEAQAIRALYAVLKQRFPA